MDYLWLWSACPKGQPACSWKRWNYMVNGLSKRKRTNMKLRVGLNNSAQQSDPICHHCSMFMRNPNTQNPKISTACYSATHPNFTVISLTLGNQVQIWLSNSIVGCLAFPTNLPSPAPNYLLLMSENLYLVSPMGTPTLHIHSCFKLLMMLLFPTFGKPTNKCKPIL